MIVGKPIRACACQASSRLWAMADLGSSSPIRRMAWRNRSRSSALSIASREAPISSTPYRASTPSRTRSRAVLSAVCPPMVGSKASGRSFSMMRSRVGQTMGSI